MSSELTLQRATCLDCLKLGSCETARERLEKYGPASILEFHSKGWKIAPPATTLARMDALQSLGLLALRGMVNNPKGLDKEDLRVSRDARKEELESLNRMELRKVAMKAGYDHKASLKAKSADMIDFILEKEFGSEPQEEAPKNATPKKASTRKKAPPKKTDEAPAAADAADLGPVLEEIGKLGQVVDSHAEVLDSVIARQGAIAGLLQLIGYAYLEPEDVDGHLGEAFPELYDEPEGN